jgi:hypothetical protein
MRAMRVCLSWFLFPVILLPLYAQESELKQYPGYVNFDEIKVPDKAGEVTEITLGPAMLKLAAMTSENDDEDLTELLAGLHGIQVKSFNIDPDEAAAIQPVMDKIEAKLNHEGWERLIQVKEEDERTIVSIKYDGKKAAGLLVMHIDPGNEASFVNVVGEIDFTKLGNLGVDLDNSVMDSLKETLEKK